MDRNNDGRLNRVELEVWLQLEEDQLINEEANHLLYITDL